MPTYMRLVHLHMPHPPTFSPVLSTAAPPMSSAEPHLGTSFLALLDAPELPSPASKAGVGYPRSGPAQRYPQQSVGAVHADITPVLQSFPKPC
jgi:hypothetical protein